MAPIKLVSIIDDDPIFTFITKRMIVSNNFSQEVIVYSDGQEALNGLINRINNKETLPEVIILDLNMPIMDGWEFLERFLDIDVKEKITIYIASSSIDQQDINRAKSIEKVSNYIVKPITSDKLTNIMQELSIT